MSGGRLIREVDAYYTAKLRAHGATPAGVDWNGEASQQLRFRQLLELLDAVEGPFSIVDYGCGYGALLEALESRWSSFEYQGFDVSEAMVEVAASRHGGDPHVSFTADRTALRPAHFAVASGIFNVKLQTSADEWYRYVIETIEDMARLAAKGLAFNALTSHADPDRKRSDLFYADPAGLLDFCLRTLSRDVSVRHDYGLYEFTVLVRLDGRQPAPAEKEAVS